MPYFNELIVFVASYLIGSILFAVWLSRCLGLADPRTIGSGNPGATNVVREHGKLTGTLVLAADVLKGLLPIWIVQQLGFSPLVVALAGLGAYLGHLFPAYHRFCGGKGMATLIGCLLGFNFLVALATVVIWGILVQLSRYVSLGSILTSLIVPVLMWQTAQPLSWTVTTILMGILTVIKHHDNISRLRAGTELKITSSKKTG